MYTSMRLKRYYHIKSSENFLNLWMGQSFLDTLCPEILPGRPFFKEFICQKESMRLCVCTCCWSVDLCMCMFMCVCVCLCWRTFWNKHNHKVDRKILMKEFTAQKYGVWSKRRETGDIYLIFRWEEANLEAYFEKPLSLFFPNFLSFDFFS